MKNERKSGFISGVVASVLVFSLVGTAAATVGKRTAELDYNDIKLYINGQPVIPKDANGNTVEPFAINGTTYLPVRAVGAALDMNVNWDATTNSVILSSKTSGGAWSGTSAAVETATPSAPVSLSNGYDGASWVPDFGAISGIDPTYYSKTDTSIYATYIVASFDTVEDYFATLESVGMSYDYAYSMAMKQADSAVSPMAYSYNGDASHSVVVDIGNDPGEVVIFVPRK